MGLYHRSDKSQIRCSSLGRINQWLWPLTGGDEGSSVSLVGSLSLECKHKSQDRAASPSKWMLTLATAVAHPNHRDNLNQSECPDRH